MWVSFFVESLLPGNSPAVQWLGLGTFTAVVQYLDGELRSQKLHGAAKKKKSVLPTFLFSYLSLFY